METIWPILSVLCLLLLLAAIGFFARNRSLATRVGSFYCAFRKTTRPAIWKHGIAHYCVDRIDWYRTASFSFRPAHTWRRDKIELITKEPLPENEVLGTRDYSTRVICECGGQEFELAMSKDSYAGLRSWVESAPPGGYGRVV